MCTSFCVNICFQFWGIYLGLGLLGRMTILHPTLWGTARFFLCYHYQCVRIPIFPHPWQHLILSIFLIIAILEVAKWYLILVLICIHLMTSDINIFSCAYWLFVYLLWRNLCSNHFPILALYYLSYCWVARVINYEF